MLVPFSLSIFIVLWLPQDREVNIESMTKLNGLIIYLMEDRPEVVQYFMSHPALG